MLTLTQRVEVALDDLRNGKMIILTDHPDRENEGDLIIAAEKITPEAMNFIIRNGTGIVCLALTEEKLAQLNLPLMVPENRNTCTRGTRFTLSVDAADDITTGVSAIDRVKTIEALLKDNANEKSYIVPGHMFPLAARNNGVLERGGHTEGSVDLVRLAGFTPAAVLCEIMNPDGSMTKGTQLIEFSEKHQINLLSIDDLIAYRIHRENLFSDQATCQLPLATHGNFTMTVVKDKLNGLEHIILSKEYAANQPVLVRIHSACATGDCFASLRCDCHDQLHYALEKIAEQGGLLIYLAQEGRGIGLLNKIKAYALQEKGLDTVEANEELGLPVDARDYLVAAHLLHAKKITAVRLLTNNPNKIASLKKYGIENVSIETMPTFQQETNLHYLQVKKNKLAHTIKLEG